jgi:hypothetical protein
MSTQTDSKQRIDFQAASPRGGHKAGVTDFTTALRQGDVGGYVNFMGEDGTERIREAYPGMTWERLRAIKSRYDPTNLFRLNHNIPPRKEQSNDG